MKHQTMRIAMAGTASLAIASGGLFALAGPATAAAVSVPAKCVTPIDPNMTSTQTIDITMPTGPIKPGKVATVKVEMGPTGVDAPVDLDNPFEFTMVMEASGGTTQEMTMTGSGTMKAAAGSAVKLPVFEGKIKIPADAKGEIKLKPKSWNTTVDMGVIGKQPTDCTPTGEAPVLGSITASADGGGDDPAAEPGDPNGKDVTVDYACDIMLNGKKFGDPLALKPTVKVVLPGQAKPNTKVAVQAEFKDNVVGEAPDKLTPPAGIDANVTPKLTIDTTGGDKKSFDVTLPAKKINIKPKQQITVDGPLVGEFTTGAAGDYSFSPGALVIGLDLGEKLKVDLTCKATTTGVSATLKAAGEPGPGTPTQTLTQTPSGAATSTGTSSGTSNGSAGGTTGNNNPGDLAHTGAQGDSMTAFAMAAGTAVLGAIGLMLFVPYRRRMRSQV
ncbi:hypothetical protein [Streptomyces sp. SID3343]|uniref:hypothetical protein n=1 Tax=Streptomyces sp. SID3343 TaxID=2690260 RepID=UPI0013681B21|nr:hypothetical protein [Streptomyces sp. SID3343]MYW03653.1 hypothetical protein [Streptomyces sp. SID3343]